MSIKDWGLKCGIEIHQQLEGKKLFCHCPTLLREDKADFTIERKLRASAGEGGKIDVAAQAEQAKGKSFVYEGYYDSTCLVELDEEPPHELNQEALHTALQFSLGSIYHFTDHSGDAKNSGGWIKYIWISAHCTRCAPWTDRHQRGNSSIDEYFPGRRFC